jgi:hypothetical protein
MIKKDTDSEYRAGLVKRFKARKKFRYLKKKPFTFFPGDEQIETMISLLNRNQTLENYEIQNK